MYISAFFSIAQSCLSVHNPNRIFGHPKRLRRSLGSLGSPTLCQGQCPCLETISGWWFQYMVSICIWIIYG